MVEHLIENPLLAKIVSVIIIFIIAYVVIAVLSKFLKKILEHMSLDESAHKFFIRLLKIILWIVTAVIILSDLGVSTAPLVAIIGASGAAVALALKSTLGNVAAGFIIMYNKTFIKDDDIEVLAVRGKVEHIDLFATTVISGEGKEITIPNSMLIDNAVINHTRQVEVLSQDR